jgi:hypothetical protein
LLDSIERHNFESIIRNALAAGNLSEAQRLSYKWLRQYVDSLPAKPSRVDLLNPKLWLVLADVVERTSDHYLIESLWQIFESVPVEQSRNESLPLLGIPILNRVDLLSQLLDSLDVHVDCLAIVDNSRIFGRQTSAATQNSVSRFLDALQQLGHPMIGKIHIARPFRNLGVASSWNHILTSFPEFPIALIANNDVVFAPGIIKQALERLDSSRPQFMPLLPPPHGFSAFLITTLCWDRIGLFDPNFINAYFEDLEFRDRLRTHPEVEQIRADFAFEEMAKLNPTHSATIESDPKLAAQNQGSYALNKLWYLSPRRFCHDQRGAWRRRWLAQWC